MILDIYKFFREQPGVNKLVGNDYLFVEYKCPIDVEEFQLSTDAHMITYVVNGKKDWISGGKVYPFRGGDAFFVRKGNYSTKQYAEVDYCVMLFFINDDFIRNFMEENRGLRIGPREKNIEELIFPVDVDSALESLFLTVFNYFKKSGSIPKNLVEIKFKELLFNIILNPRNHQIAQFFQQVKQCERNSLATVMQKNFQYDLSMEEFARLSGRSLSTFKRDFKTYYKETPGRWLSKKRLEFAKTLLLNSDLDVNQVGYESGFKNSSHFNKVFKEKFQIPPARFRKQAQVSLGQ